MRHRFDTSRLRRALNDTLVLGAVALLITAVAVLVSYRAQNGLPWQQTYDLSVDVPDAAKLLKNADVRIGGARVGQVLRIEPQPAGEDHPPFTRLGLALQPGVGPLPADTTAEVRLASVLGGKFVDLVPGHAEQTIAEGGVLPLENGRLGSDQDEALQVFDPDSREALRSLLAEASGGLAGRGTTLNRTIGAAARSMPAARRVLGVLAAQRTDLAGFVRGAGAAARAVEPLAGGLGRLIDDTATTLEAIEAAGSLDRVLAASPGAVGATADAVTAVRPVLDDAAAVMAALEPASLVLEDSLAEVDATLRAALPVVGRVGGLAPAMGDALEAVDTFAGEPAALGAIRALGGEDLATFGGSAFIGLGAILRTVATAQLECNTAALWVRNLASIASEGDSSGNWLRMIAVNEPSETSHAAEQSDTLHVNPYPHQNRRECEAGNEGYEPGRQVGNPPGAQSKDVEITDREWP